VGVGSGGRREWWVGAGICRWRGGMGQGAGIGRDCIVPV
jgi:hypothetical protein